MLRRPKRACTTKTLEKIKEIHEWENLNEHSEAFKSMAVELDKHFENEDLTDEKQNTENEDSDAVEVESDALETSSEDDESYESSFVTSDSDVDDEDSEWTPRVFTTHEQKTNTEDCKDDPFSIEPIPDNYLVDSADGVLQQVYPEDMFNEQVLSCITFPDEETGKMPLSEEFEL